MDFGNKMARVELVVLGIFLKPVLGLRLRALCKQWTYRSAFEPALFGAGCILHEVVI